MSAKLGLNLQIACPTEELPVISQATLYNLVISQTPLESTFIYSILTRFAATQLQPGIMSNVPLHFLTGPECASLSSLPETLHRPLLQMTEGILRGATWQTTEPVARCLVLD